MSTPKKKSNIVASVHLPGKVRFYVRTNDYGEFRVMRGSKVNTKEDDLVKAIEKMLRIAYFETKQTSIDFKY